jgi:arsenite-transporting ATPase
LVLNDPALGTLHSQLIVEKLKRVNLISGKGGVGRSTLAAVLAKTSAGSGKRTLLAELEDDHGSDSALAKNFSLKHFSDEPSMIEKNLYAMRLSPQVGQELFLNSFLRISALTTSIMKNKGIQYFLEGAPAFKEMGYFYHLLLQLRKKEFDRIIIDLPATGHLVGLAKLPRILLRLIPIGPIADRLREGQSYFYDVDQTAAWIVTLPQTLPVSEAIELKNALVLETVPIGGFILNRAPFNPFTPEEEKEMEALFQSSDSVAEVGDVANSLERIRRYREAEKKLCVETTKNSAGIESPLDLFVAQEVFQPIVELTSTSPVRSVSC